MGPLFEFHRWGSFPTALRGHFPLKGSAPSRVLSFSWGVRETSLAKSTMTECVKRVMVVYTRSVDFFYGLICWVTSTVSSWCHAGTVIT